MDIDIRECVHNGMCDSLELLDTLIDSVWPEAKRDQVKSPREDPHDYFVEPGSGKFPIATAVAVENGAGWDYAYTLRIPIHFTTTPWIDPKAKPDNDTGYMRAASLLEIMGAQPGEITVESKKGGAMMGPIKYRGWKVPRLDGDGEPLKVMDSLLKKNPDATMNNLLSRIEL